MVWTLRSLPLFINGEFPKTGGEISEVVRGEAGGSGDYSSRSCTTRWRSDCDVWDVDMAGVMLRWQYPSQLLRFGVSRVCLGLLPHESRKK